ncbi:putative Calcium uniporter protein, mitochondrial [Hypsibius exemplaris]|uniref:Calcium uniporter protein n=1 Tax=Hypsibius exemplaris TaxID=2072580 RepID=A0A1W0WEN5_HYPEX|nr:putative Calcium uniporter protein, mitochondrial [Hypsibius exemplaris]
MHSTSRRILIKGLRGSSPLCHDTAVTLLPQPSSLFARSVCLYRGPPNRAAKGGGDVRQRELVPGKVRIVSPVWTRRSSTQPAKAAADSSLVAAKDERNSSSTESPLITPEVQDELRQLHHIRAMVSQLYMALHVPDTYQTEMDTMRKQLEEIRAELQPLEEKKIQLLMRAERRSKILAWGGLGFMGMQFGFLARLTWWEYSWDIIEPVTYFVTYATAMGLYAYFLVTRQDVNFPGITERWTAVAFHKNVKRSKWEMTRYIQLKDKLAHMQAEVERMSLLLPQPKSSSTVKQ